MQGLTVNKSRFRIVLEVEAFNDLNPYKIDWEKAMRLDGGESVRVINVEEDDDYMF